MIGKYLKKIFFFVSPFVFYEISGRSMYPTFHHGQKVIVKKKWFFTSYKISDVIVFKNFQNSLLHMKRIEKIHGKKLFLVGDNTKESTDSRTFGWIEKKQTIGKVIAS